jgi:alkaline phosphatase D
MHYTAAHYYDPNAAVFQDFEPFWEFISGPIHAGTWHPQQLDNTFGPRAVFQKGCGKDQRDDLAPCFGLQFFGHVSIAGADRGHDRHAQGHRGPQALVDRAEPRMEKWSRGDVARPRLATRRRASGTMPRNRRLSPQPS